jgi:hypothetical protein
VKSLTAWVVVAGGLLCLLGCSESSTSQGASSNSFGTPAAAPAGFAPLPNPGSSASAQATSALPFIGAEEEQDEPPPSEPQPCASGASLTGDVCTREVEVAGAVRCAEFEVQTHCVPDACIPMVASDGGCAYALDASRLLGVPIIHTPLCFADIEGLCACSGDCDASDDPASDAQAPSAEPEDARDAQSQASDPDAALGERDETVGGRSAGTESDGGAPRHTSDAGALESRDPPGG